jgi:hypothetical protein
MQSTKQPGAKKRALATEDDIKAGKQSKLNLSSLFPRPAKSPETVDVAEIVDNDFLQCTLHFMKTYLLSMQPLLETIWSNSFRCISD